MSTVCLTYFVHQLQIPAIVYFEKQIPNIYDGDLMDEEEILHWLVSQLEHDEIEDVTDEMLDKMVKEGRVLAVLFCKYHSSTYSLELMPPSTPWNLLII